MTIVYFIIALGILVTVHEWGHLIIAKRNGIKVEAFSIGFGPKLFGFNFGDTEYKVCLIPLGGYVKMLGEHPEDEGAGEARSYVKQTVWSRLKVVTAGPAMNIVLCILLMPVVFMLGRMEPKYLKEAPVVEQVKMNSDAMIAGVTPGYRIVSVGGVDVSTWREAMDQIILSGGAPVEIAFDQTGTRVVKTLKPTELKDRKGYYVGVEPFIFLGNEPVLDTVVPDSAAAEAGLLSGDVVVEAAGKPVQTWTDMTEAIAANEGTAINVTVRRDGQLVSVSLTPRYDDGYKRWVIGVQKNMETMNSQYEEVSYSFFPAIKKGWEESLRLMGLTVDVLKKLFSFQLSIKALGGPVQIAQASAVAASNGLSDFIHFMCFLSIQLGILNLLPIPVLDGGHVVFLGIEAIRRKPLSIRTQQIFQQVGLSLLLLLFAVVTFNDLDHLLGIKAFLAKWF